MSDRTEPIAESRTGTLYLVPVPLGSSPNGTVLPGDVIERARNLTHFLAENPKSARGFLKSLPASTPLQQIEIRELSEHTPENALPELLAPLLAGIDVGMVSEAGCPAVADPGGKLVALAHERNIRVVPLVGPSSILLALMGSGLSGQNFCFHGYLPAKTEDREKKIRELEKESRQAKRTQIFIETPYRNQQMLEALLKSCAPSTKICIASDLTLISEQIETRTSNEWKRRRLPDINRRPTIFLMQS